MSGEILKYAAGFFAAAVIFYVRERMRRRSDKEARAMDAVIIESLEHLNAELRDENERLKRVEAAVVSARSRSLN